MGPDNTVKVEIDEEEIYSGSIKEDWEVLKPKEISDPDDKKPSDWVDEAMMDDPDDKKPDDWVDEKRIVDPEASNPDDKGDWSVKRISNPAYKGVWTAAKIANPEYVDDNEVYKYADFGFIGFDLWQVKGGTIFDNVIITDDVAEADKFAQKWKTLSTYEKEQKTAEDAEKKAAADKAAESDDDDDDDADSSESEEM